MASTSLAGNTAGSSDMATVKLSMEVVRIKRIPQREFEQPATSVVTLTPKLMTYSGGEASSSIPLGSVVGGSGLRAAMALASSSSNPSSPSRSGECEALHSSNGGSSSSHYGAGGGGERGGTHLHGDAGNNNDDSKDVRVFSVTPEVYVSQEVFHDNDPYYNDRVEFVGLMPDDEGAGSGGAILQGFPAGVTIPPIGHDGKPLKGGSPTDTAGSTLPSIPKPPAAGVSGKSARKSVVSLIPPSISSTITATTTMSNEGSGGPSSSVRRQSRAGASEGLGDGGNPLIGVGSSSSSGGPNSSNSRHRHSITGLGLVPPSESRTPHFCITVAVHDHNKPATPVLVLKGRLEIPAVQTKGTSEVTLSVALSPSSADPSSVSPIPVRDEIDVICPLLVVRYKVSVTKPAKEPVDQHADVLLEDEPRYTPDHQLVPDVTQYSWYHLLNDRPWLQNFSHALITQWSALPKIVYDSERSAGKSPKKKGVGAPTFGGARPGSSTRRSSTAGAASAVTYTSIADLMINHWSVRRSHEAVTRIRLVADKYCRGEHMGFTAMEEYRLKLQWRERQVLRTAMAVDLLSDYSGSQVRVLLDRLWLNMVYGVPADDPSPPPLTYDMRSKLQNIAFTSKHAAILRACMLQHLIHGLNYNDALKIATEDFEPKNVTYVSRRGSLVGGEYVKSEAIMMAFGQPVKPSVPPPLNDVSEIEQIHRLLEDNKRNIKTHRRRSKSRERRDTGAVDGDGDGMHDTHSATLNGTMANATLNSTTAVLGGTLAATQISLAASSVKAGGAAGTRGDLGVGPNGCPVRETDFPTPTTYTSQKVFTTVVIDFVGRLLETLTDHEFIMLLTAFVPAVTAASEKCLMVSSGLPSTYKSLPKRGSSAKKRGGSARPKSSKRANSAMSGGGSVPSVGSMKEPHSSGAAAHISGPVQIEYLDSLGRKLPKKEKKRMSIAAASAAANPQRNETAIAPEEDEGKGEGKEGEEPSTKTREGGAAVLTTVADHVSFLSSEEDATVDKTSDTESAALISS